MICTECRIDGMSCSMCESHINDAVRNSFSVKKVSSDHKKGILKIISEAEIPEEALEPVLRGLGYRILSCSSGPYEKKGLFGR